jgi:dihydroorotase
VQMATTVPALVINRMPKLGTLQVGAPADATLIEIVSAAVEFVDTRTNKRQGNAYIKPVQTVIGGVPFGRPYNSPFSVR